MNWAILIVDDSALVRAQLRGHLEAKGVCVSEAADGRQGLWRASESKFDLVLADVHMPVMDGIQMTKELRKLPNYQDTPIFVLTSDASAERAEDGKRAGANAWIIKPVNPDLLWGAIERALRNASVKASHESAAQSRRSGSK